MSRLIIWIIVLVIITSCGDPSNTSPTAALTSTSIPVTQIPASRDIPKLPPTPAQNPAPAPANCPSMPPATSEQSQPLSTNVGDVVVSSYAPLYVRLEDAVRLVVVITNNGTQPATVVDQQLELDWLQPPNDPNRRWYTQLFTLHAGSQMLPPNTSTELAWHIDMDGDLEERGEIPIVRVQLAIDDTPTTLDIPIYSQTRFGDPTQIGLAFDAIVNGVVVDAQNQPQANIDVSAHLFTFKERIGETRSDELGRFTLCIPSQDALNNRLGQRPSGYELATHIIAKGPNGEYAMHSAKPASNQTVDVTLHLAQPQSPFTLKETWSQRYTTTHGWFWIYPLADGFAFTEARHPPELHQPGQVAVATSLATWSIPTADECWGFDVASTELIAASCHDGSISVWQADGTLLWQRKSERSQGMYNRHVRFSPDGKTLITGPLEADAELLDAQTGDQIWAYVAPTPSDAIPYDILRNAAFSPDGAFVTLGFAGGWLVQLNSSDGSIRWQGGYIGEFPLSLSVASDGTSYAIGKGRELVAYDRDGQLMWKTALYEAVTTASLHALTADTIFGHTVNGSVWAVDRATGALRWWRKPGIGDGHTKFAESSGHNTLDIDINRQLIAHAQVIDAQDGGGSVINLLTFDGVLLDSVAIPDAREQAGERVDHQIRGAMGLAFHPDGRLGVAYGDGFIRIFTIE